MNIPITQLVALTCHANGFLRGLLVPELYPGNSTCESCDWIRFYTLSKRLLGKVHQTEVAANPNGWFEYLQAEDVPEVHLLCAPQDDPGTPQQMLGTFVEGGYRWFMRVTDRTGHTVCWVPKWEVWSQSVPERRVWHVSYLRVVEAQFRSEPFIDLDTAMAHLRAALQDIYTFSERHDCGSFTIAFARAIKTLESRGSILHGTHTDLAPGGGLPRLAQCLLDACQSAWVFGGAGSWNDLRFEGTAQAEYHRVSEQLLGRLNEAICTGANSSCASRTNLSSTACSVR